MKFCLARAKDREWADLLPFMEYHKPLEWLKKSWQVKNCHKKALIQLLQSGVGSFIHNKRG
jgi:hypothetical protein